MAVPEEKTGGSLQGSSPESLGRTAARQLIRRWPGRLGSTGVDLKGLAGDLGVDVELRGNIAAGARWYRRRREPPTAPRLWGDPPLAPQDIVHLRKDVGGSARRFLFAHELGHAVLDRRLKGRSTELPVEAQERFANAFAAELLLPGSLARELKDPFLVAAGVRELLDLVKPVGVPPRVLLRRASKENWLVGMDVVWLDIRTAPHRQTGRDRRPRLYDSIYDRGRWFLPPNRSVQGVFGTDAWLATADPSMAMNGTMDISRLRGEPARFVHMEVPAIADAFRLRRDEGGAGPEILARIELFPEGPLDGV